MRGLAGPLAAALLTGCTTLGNGRVDLPWGEPRTRVGAYLIDAYERCPECAVDRLLVAIDVARWVAGVTGANTVVGILEAIDDLLQRHRAGDTAPVETKIAASAADLTDQERMAAAYAVTVAQ